MNNLSFYGILNHYEKLDFNDCYPQVNEWKKSPLQRRIKLGLEISRKERKEVEHKKDRVIDKMMRPPIKNNKN